MTGHPHMSCLSRTWHMSVVGYISVLEPFSRRLSLQGGSSGGWPTDEAAPDCPMLQASNISQHCRRNQPCRSGSIDAIFRKECGAGTYVGIKDTGWEQAACVHGSPELKYGRQKGQSGQVTISVQ